MSQYKVQTHLLEIKALITRDNTGFYAFLAEALVEQRVLVEVLDETKQQPSNLISRQVLQTTRSVSKKDLGKYSYAFLCINTNQEPSNLVDEILKNEGLVHSKICVVITDYPRSKKLIKKVDEFLSRLGSLAQERRLDVRVVNLHELYGPRLLSAKSSVVGKLLDQATLPKIVLPTSNQNMITPLHVDDAVSLVLKATFVRETSGMVYEAGGQEVTCINLALKIKQLSNLPNQVIEDELNIQDPNTDLIELIKLTQEKLRWQPKTNLDSGLKETLGKLHEHYLDKSRAETGSTNTQSTPAPTSALAGAAKLTILQELKPAIVSAAVPVVETIPANESVEVVTPPKNNSKTFNLSKNKPNTTTLIENDKKLPNKPKLKLFKISRPSLIKPLVFRPSWGLMVLSVFLILLLHQGLSVIYHGVRLKQLSQTTQTLVAEGNWEELPTKLNSLSWHHQGLEILFNRYRLIIALIAGDELVRDLGLFVQAAGKIVESGQVVAESLEQVDTIFSYMLANEEGDFVGQVSVLESNFAKAYHRLSLAQADLSKISDPQKISFVGSVKEYSTQVSQLRGYLEQAQRLASVTPELVGVNGKRVYLVLLQNNMELRPTGGFIGSFATITFDKGRLIDLKVEDVYAADGQLRGYVEPPEPIEKYLGEASWFLRDSNWSPNFPTAAETASWFLNKQMGINVDGVIGVNLFVVKDLLNTIGPVELVDYQETITAENLYERAQYQSEINFFPGSTQKRDYLGQLTRNLYQKIRQADQQVLIAVGKSLLRSASQKQLLVAINNPVADSVVSQLNWAGELAQPECQTVLAQSCVVDYLAIREANVGVNKANYFLSRDLSSKVTVAPGEIFHQLTLNLENTSQTDVWPGGPYRSYVRIYTDKLGLFSKLSVGNKLVSRDLIDIESEFGKISHGFFVEVPSGTTQEIIFEYTLPAPENEPLFGYQLYLQKQPGTDADPYRIVIDHSPQIQVVQSSLATEDKPMNLSESTTLETDKSYTIEFSR